MSDDTLLTISSPFGLPIYSARGLTQTLTPIKASSNQRRDINGVLTDIALSMFQKYESKITCTDVRVPSMDGVWPGQIVTVDCACELSYPSTGTPQRPAVGGSTHLSEDGLFYFYRPVMIMMFVGQTPNTSFDEWGADVHWEAYFEEV